MADLLQGATPELTGDLRKKTIELLCEFTDRFSTGETDLGRVDLCPHRIDIGDARPVSQALCRQPYAYREAIEKGVQDLLSADVITPSNSPWASNIVMVRKKDGTMRFCVDFRKVNEVTREDKFPLPRIDVCLDTLAGSKYFSTFDLRSGYFQAVMDPRDSDKTSFITQSGSYKFNRLPMGLCNAGATFQRVMNTIMQGLNFITCLIYLDDIIVFSHTISEHIDRLRQMFSRLRIHNLKLKPSKCRLFNPGSLFGTHCVV